MVFFSDETHNGFFCFLYCSFSLELKYVSYLIVNQKWLLCLMKIRVALIAPPEFEP